MTRNKGAIMRTITIASTILCGFLLASAASAADGVDEIVLSGDYIIPVTVNTLPFKLQIVPGIGEHRVLNADTAAKLALKPSMIGGVHMVGPVKLSANSNVLNYNFNGVQDKRRTFWFSDRAASTLADGIAPPAALPYKIVRFQMKAAQLGEEIYTLPIADGGTRAELTVNGKVMDIGFDLMRKETLVTASAGLLLSESFDGGFSGPAVATLIRFGVERPVRPMTLKQTMDIGGLPLNSLLVRVSDFGDATQIKDADAADSDEIIVTAASKKKPKYQMTLGSDFLSRCSSLTFDYKVKQVQISCQL
jgi:hypothetical protein